MFLYTFCMQKNEKERETQILKTFNCLWLFWSRDQERLLVNSCYKCSFTRCHENKESVSSRSRLLHERGRGGNQGDPNTDSALITLGIIPQLPAWQLVPRLSQHVVELGLGSTGDWASGPWAVGVWVGNLMGRTSKTYECPQGAGTEPPDPLLISSRNQAHACNMRC